jgi:hypothetical protein
MKGVIRGHGPTKAYLLDGVEVSKEEFDEAIPNAPVVEGDGEGLIGWHRAIESDALACHPLQIPEIMARNAKHGLHVEYNAEDGRPILRDRGQRRALLKIEGMIDRQGGYSD